MRTSQATGRIRWLALLVCGSLVVGCQTPYALPDYTKVVIAAPVNGVVHVYGRPGAIRGGDASTVTLTIVREGGVVPGQYHVEHLASGVPVASTFANVLPDGSFTEATMGSAERPVQSGDELNLTPIKGISQVGPAVPLPVP